MGKTFWFLLYILCNHLEIVISFENQIYSVDETFQFIENAQSKLKLAENRNVNLVVGNTGTGKSALVHYVAGDYSKIESIEPEGHESEYKIYDALDPDIGNVAISTTVSRTIVPEMIIDEEQNVWYDCPGFGDTRNSTIEIATTFLIKSIIENVSNMKIVLVTSYESVTKGHDRQNFDRLLSHVTVLLKRIESFHDSISLVVTKVPSYYTRKGKSIDVPEDSVKNTTAQFMNAHRSALREKGSQEKKIQLIDSLLTKTSEGDYSKISVFWRPPDSGSFDKIDKMVDGRRSIRRSILEHTSFAQIDKNDFGFPLTAETRIHIENMERQVIVNITSSLAGIDNQLLNALQQKVNTRGNFHKKHEYLSLGKDHIQFIPENDTMNLQQLIKKFSFMIRVFNLTNINEDILKPIEKHENDFNILKKIIETQINLPMRDLMVSSSKTANYWLAEYNWYSFLFWTFSLLVKYEVQRDVSAYNVANLSDWGQFNKPQGLTIDANNFNEFLQRIQGNIDTVPTQSQLNELNEIIDVMLKSPIEYECNEETMIIRGIFVKSSDIQPSKCSANRILKINIFVAHTFYVNKDLNLNGLQEIKIFAHKWIILQPTTFNFNGLDGHSHVNLDSKGKQGNPGNAGLPGGNFYGQANEMVNGDLLTVNINGGTGGPGQDGTGSDDVSVAFHQHKNSKQVAVFDVIDNVVTNYYKNFFRERGYNAELLSIDSYISYYAVLAAGKEIVHIFRLKPDRCCGVTGIGGIGGNGGLNGYFTFKYTGKKISNYLPKVNANIGTAGGKGRDGRFCESTALDVTIETTANLVIIPFTAKIYSVFTTKTIASPDCRNKIVNNTIPEVSEPIVRKELNFNLESNEYKSFLLAKLSKLPIKEIVRENLAAIDDNKSL